MTVGEFLFLLILFLVFAISNSNEFIPNEGDAKRKVSKHSHEVAGKRQQLRNRNDGKKGKSSRDSYTLAGHLVHKNCSKNTPGKQINTLHADPV
ncbi:hypothetical protein KIN20_037969 [Parelaphostrongylus tenuis]|uniref:Secreted protein n=1 Tax=Parelaphostrongylus tenuis TaxID=148309 RepID=A0AAD5REK2_PARTN|nr:hypothetical protein KIN20_037969 [Parelaphostrongylus tenuis]